MKTIMNKNLEVRSEQLETNRSAALRYSSNSYLLTPDSLPSRQRRDSGMILLLVIALLVLLALMGTVFILMASADRKSAYASNSTASLNMAQQGVLNTVRGLMLNQTLDQSNGTYAVGQYYPLATTTAPVEPAGYVPNQYSLAQGTTGQIARYWDYPEIGPMTTATPSNAQFYQSVIVPGATPGTPTQYAPSEPWLVSTLPYEPFSNYAPGERVFYCAPQTLYPNQPHQGLPVARSVGVYIYDGTANTFASEAPPGTGAWVAAGTSQVPVPAGEATPFGGAGTITTPLISCLSPYLYDPTTGVYDIGYSFSGAANLPPLAGGTVVVPNASVVEPRWQFYPTNNPQLTKLGNATYATGPDAMWNLLPYSDPNGTRYRFAVRIVDTSAMLNVNTGWIANAFANSATNTSEASDPYAKCGAFIASGQILNAPNLDIDNLITFVSGTKSYTDYTYAEQNGSPAQLGNPSANPTTAGRSGKYGEYTPVGSFYNLPVWQGVLDDYEQQYPTNGPPGYFAVVTPPAPWSADLFGTNTEMDLLTGGGAGGAAFGSPTYSRLATLMPDTFGLPLTSAGDYYGSGYRSLYTDLSWSRDYNAVTINKATAPAGAPASVVAAATAMQTQIGPMRLDLNNATPSQAFCTELYEMLVDCGFSYPHAAAYVVNYLSYLQGNGTVAIGGVDYAEPPIIQYVAAPIGGGPPGEFLQDPAIPSSMATAASSGWPMYCMASGLNQVPATATPDQNTYVGLTAQPFLNELEVQIKTNGTAGTYAQAGAAIQHWTLELINPYPGSNPLNLVGWQVLVNGTVVNGAITSGTALPLASLTGGSFPNGEMGSYGNPAGSGGAFAVVLSDPSDPILSVGVKTPTASSNPGLAAIPATGTMELLRPVPNPTAPGTVSYAVVDVLSYNFSGLTFTTAKTWYSDVQRSNNLEWSCDSFPAGLAMAPALPAQPTPLTAAEGGPGVENTQPIAAAGNAGVPLFDRVYSGGVYDGAGDFIAPLDPKGFINLDDFNCIARETNYVDSATGTAETIASQINANVAYATPTLPYPPPTGVTSPPSVSSPFAYTTSNNGMTYVKYARSLGAAKDPTFSNEIDDSALYFDFAYDPRAAYSAATQVYGYPEDPILAVNTGGSVARTSFGEMAPNILSMVSITYRSASPASAALPEGATDLVRLPGKININTAGPDVLYSAFSDDGALWSGSVAPTAPYISNLVDAAIAFRDRLDTTVASPGSYVPNFVATGTGTSANTTVTMAKNPLLNFKYSAAGYVGTGFRTRADLLTAMLPVIDTAGGLYTGSVVPTTIQQRDAAWADVANFITVRSDTFAVYGLVQALRLNPAYSAAYAAGSATYLPTDWYNANQGVAIGAVPTQYSISTDPTNQNAEFILEGSRRFIAIVDRSYCNDGATVQPHIVALKILPQ
jgi:hypothetical protein